MTAFLAKAWEWLKKNWMWVLLPVGLLLLVFGVLKPRPKVIGSQLHDAAVAANKARAEADKRAAEAAAARDAEVKRIEAEHAESIKKLTDSQKKTVEELRTDPEALNKYLLDVGKQIRG